MMPIGKLTLEQIAKSSGLCHSTVSPVVNDPIHVKPHVRQRALDIMTKTGCQLDSAAHPLADQRSEVIFQTIQFLFTAAVQLICRLIGQMPKEVSLDKRGYVFCLKEGAFAGHTVSERRLMTEPT